MNHLFAFSFFILIKKFWNLLIVEAYEYDIILN